MMTQLTSAEKRAIGVGLIVKVVVSLSIVLSFYTFSDFANVQNLWNRWYTGKEDVQSWYIPFANWDGQHYLLLSDWGYNHWDLSKGFFPLYPLLVRLLSQVLSPATAALVLGLASIVGICYFLHKLSEHYHCRGWHLVILMVLAFPTAFYLSVIYSESLFLFLQLGFVYHLLVTQNNKGLLYAALLPLTRGTALFLAVGLFAYMLLQYARFKNADAVSDEKERGKRPRSRRSRSRSRRRRKNAQFGWHYYLKYFGAFFAGGLLYLAFCDLVLGDPFLSFSAQDYIVSQHKLSNIFNPAHFVGYLFYERQDWFSYTYGMFDKVFVIGLLLCSVIFVVFKEWSLLCFYFPLIYCHAAMGNGMSFSRYALLAIPFLALMLAKNVKHVWFLYVLCIASFALELYLLHRFSLNLWVG